MRTVWDEIHGSIGRRLQDAFELEDVEADERLTTDEVQEIPYEEDEPEKK